MMSNTCPRCTMDAVICICLTHCGALGCAGGVHSAVSVTTGGDETRTAVRAALHTLDFGQVSKDDMADAAISAYETNPPAWLTQLAQTVHGYSCGPVYGGHSPRCSAVPRAVRVAAGIEVEKP